MADPSNKELLRNMVEDPITNLSDLEVKLFRAEMAYKDDYKRKGFLIERLPDKYIIKMIKDKVQNKPWNEFKKYHIKVITEEEKQEKIEKIKKEEENKQKFNLENLLNEKLKINENQQKSKQELLRKLLMFNRQGYTETLEEYMIQLFDGAKEQPFEDKKGNTRSKLVSENMTSI